MDEVAAAPEPGTGSEVSVLTAGGKLAAFAGVVQW